jgi:hypothetical protein
LWPGDAIARSDGTAVNYYEWVLAGVAPYDLLRVGTGIAVLEPGSTVARRLLDAGGDPLLLFDYHEPNFLHAVAGRRNGDERSAGERMVYVYASTDRRECTVDVVVGRAPLSRAADREAYRFWNGAEWVTDLQDARPVLDDVAGGLGSVAWNDYLGAYLAGFNDICTGGSRLLLRTSPRPQGPWSDAVVVDLAPLGAGPDAYAGRLHPALGTGRHVVIGFYQPEVRGGEVVGRVHLARLELVREPLR